MFPEHGFQPKIRVHQRPAAAPDYIGFDLRKDNIFLTAKQFKLFKITFYGDFKLITQKDRMFKSVITFPLLPVKININFIQLQTAVINDFFS